MRHFFAKKSWAIAHVRQRASPMFFVACSVKTGSGDGVFGEVWVRRRKTVKSQQLMRRRKGKGTIEGYMS